MIRARHIARPRKLKHTKQRLSSNLRRRSRRRPRSAANQTWSCFGFRRCATRTRSGHGRHAPMRNLRHLCRPLLSFHSLRHSRANTGLCIRFLVCSAGFRLAHPLPPPQRIAHAAARCQETEGLKPVGSIHIHRWILRGHPCWLGACSPFQPQKPITRPKVPIPSRRIDTMPRKPIRDAVFAWGNLLAPLPCT
jgi:hypothetical protein